MDKIEEIINKINKHNIDDAIYLYATLLEKLVEIKELIDNDDENMDIGSDDCEELLNVNLDLPVSVQRNGKRKKENNN